MQNIRIKLKSPISQSFMAKKASNSVDLNEEEKAYHNLNIDNIDIETDYNIGLIVGASGSGKTSLARNLFGDNFDDKTINPREAIIDQFEDSFSYDERVNLLTSIGLSQIPCWIKPVGLLSNGQQERAKVCKKISEKRDLYIFDEWTSVVDRSVASVMSHALQKYSRRNNMRVIVLSCHYDVEDWLNPDWIIDCNEQSFINRRDKVEKFQRKKKIRFDIRECSRKSWRKFSKYHYLSDNLPGGTVRFFGLFLEGKQIGFQCFANYTPHSDKTQKMKMHSNRTVIHPDYVGFGLGIKLINETSKIMVEKGFDVWAKFSSLPVYKSMKKQKCWKLINVSNNLKVSVGKLNRARTGMEKTGIREKVKTYSFKYIGSQKIT